MFNLKLLDSMLEETNLSSQEEIKIREFVMHDQKIRDNVYSKIESTGIE